ncbi:MAG TPA: hypothetical protein VKB93_24770 [Thermoanaerobaculia bacterium]|nr:hypothetical protein [Thermoanaerobaculia bacterium]
MVSASILVLATTLRFFGSAGAESQLTPARAQLNLADVSAFGDATSERWKLHLKLRADASDGSADRVRAGEAYVQLHAATWLDVTAGRVIDKWGTGYGWNPTSFVGPAKNPADPNDRRSANRGVDMIRADVFVKETNVSLYALEDGQYAARVYRLIRGTDVSLVWRSGGAAGFSPPNADRRAEARRSTGIALARVFGNALELHAEATQHRALVGGQYTFGNDINVVVEMYYERKPYAFVRVHRPSPRFDAELIAISSDGSTIVRASLSRKLAPSVSAYLIQTEFLGREKPVARLTTAGVRYYF